MITYGSTTLTSYNTITKIEVYYYKSTSATSLSGGSWSTTKPTWENGKYIWQKIRTTYEGKLENGSYYSESDPVNITGQQGATGTAAYSYKLNASDTTVTVSKIGTYSINKITFTATSKQGTGSVNAYAGRFKIETTTNGTTWTTSYTSSGNESSKEFTIPTGIIAIRCSLYQANGTTTLLDIMTIPILSDDRPIATKTYTGLIGSANDAANASFYFAKIHPDSYTTNYKVKMKVRVTAPEAYAETIDIQFGGYGNTFSSFDAYTTRTGSVGVYYINLYRATQAGISTNHKGHALGIGLRSSTNPTSTSYKRTIIVDILELDGCTIEMLDTAVKYASIDGTGSTNYYGLTEMAVGTAGQNATNNTNTHYTQYSNNVKAGTNGIKGYTLIMKDSENTWSCFYSGAYKVANTGKPAYTGGFMLGKILYSAGAGVQTSNSSLDTYYNYKLGVNTSTIYDAYPVDLRYSTNCASTLTSQRPVYIVGTIENDGLFHLDVSQWYTQTEPTYADGKVYVYVGMAYSSYQVWLSTENPTYMFYNGSFITIEEAEAEKAQNLATAVYGTCSTGATTVDKIITCPNFTLFNGARIQVTFTNANTASAPTLNVNSTGAKPIYINKTVTSSSNLLLWTAGSKMEFVYDGTGWIAQNVPYALYGTCSTGASTAAKAVTCNEAVICKGTTISINMTNTNTAANATLNVGSTVAKDIYANDAKLTVNSRFNWRANTVQKFVFDGQVWRMDDDSVKALATAYITEIDDDGIMVHPEDDSNSGWAISDAIQLFKNGISYIKLWIENNIPKIRIGKEDQGHIILDNDSVDIRNDNKILASFGETSIIGNPSEATHTEISKGGFRMYINDIQVLNLRTTNILEHGYARQHTFFTAVSSRTSFELSFHLAQLISVYYTDNQEELPTPTISEDGYQAIFPTSPQINRQFVIVYYTDEVSYDITLGTRSSDLGYYPGTYSACIGRANIARYQYSTAIGHGIQALRAEQTILGRWNNPDHDGDTIKYNFLIGNGTSNINRLNAFGITDDNNIHIALDTTASSGTTDAELYDAIKALGWEDDVIK